MRVFTTVPQHDLRRVPEAARAAEAEGYDGIISMENQHDPFLALAVAGAATERIELHTGVAISFARTPMGWRRSAGTWLARPMAASWSGSARRCGRITSAGFWCRGPRRPRACA